jgi:hypothetical protein
MKNFDYCVLNSRDLSGPISKAQHWISRTYLTRLAVSAIILINILSITTGCSSLSQTSSSGTNTINNPIVSVTPTVGPTPTASVSLPQGNDLTFETIVEPGRVGGPYQEDSAQIRVISFIQTPLPEALNWVYPDSETKILAVDYSQYFVVIVFNGYRGGIFSYLRIQRIWQNAGAIYVLAHFNDFQPAATALPATNSQYQAVKISRTQITQSGAFTFRLLDETGQERATVTANILATTIPTQSISGG